MTTIRRTIRKALWALAVPLGVGLALAGCDEEFLDTQPLGSLTGGTFYQTEADFEAATLGSYSTMLNLTYEQNGTGWWNGFLKPDDDVRHRDPNDANDYFNWNANNGDFSWVWLTAYKGIMRANVVIQQLPEATGFTDEANKARYEAEARYMRAWWYFILARNWGNVPILTEVVSTIDAAQVGNSQPGEVWDLMEEDLQFAADNLPGSYPNLGRATRWTALSLLGKVEIFRAQWEGDNAKYGEAITHLSEVVNSGPYSLVTDYGENFLESTENNSESVFELQATVGDNINAWGTTDTGTGRAAHAWEIYVSPSCYYGPNGGCALLPWQAGYGQIDVTQALVDEFEPGDPRAYYTFYSTGEQYGSGIYNTNEAGDTVWWSGTHHTPAKYNRPWRESRPQNIWNSTTNNLRLFRYSEVLLLLAEAELLGGGGSAAALPYINQVRQRARDTFNTLCGGTPPPTLDCGLTNVVPDLTTVTMADIMHERRVELATETKRYDDLVRWHRAGLINVATDITWGYPDNTGWSETHLLKPIPQGELDLNEDLTQNPGY